MVSVDERELEQIALEFRAQLGLLGPVINEQVTRVILPGKRSINFNFVHNRYAEMRATLDRLEHLLAEAQLQRSH